MLKKHANIHDKFFKEAMADINIAKIFFQQHLPKYIQSKINLTSLKQANSLFINAEFKLREADLVYKVNFKSKKNKVDYAYLLLEHQSTPDKNIPMRLVNYMLNIAEYNAKQDNKTTGKLQMIYPMVIYTGKRKYYYLMEALKIFGENKKTVQKILTQPLKLINLSEEKLNNKKLNLNLRYYLKYNLMMQSMKNIYAKDLLPFIKKIIKNIKMLETGGEIAYINKLLFYFFEAGNISNEKVFEKFVSSELSKTDGESAMTPAELYRRKGKKEGRREGKREGERLTELRIAKNLFRQGVDLSLIAKATGLSSTELSSLKREGL